MADPAEARDLAAVQKGAAQTWERRLVELLKGLGETLDVRVRPENVLSEEQRRQLASLGYLGGALAFGAALAALAALYFWTRTNRVFLFWAAFILTRPLGATVGDFLDKPLAKGGLDFSRPLATLVLGVAILVLILLLPQRPGRHPGAEPAA